MMGGMRGMGAHGMNVANMDSLTDETVVGAAYDHKVVVRLMTYIWPYKKDAIICVLAVLLYTLGNAAIPLLVLKGIVWAIDPGDTSRLHIIGLLFVAVTILHFGANFVQFVYIP